MYSKLAHVEFINKNNSQTYVDFVQKPQIKVFIDMQHLVWNKSIR